MPLIGRGSELAAVGRLLDAAAAGTGGHLIVTGPPGAGKTALAEAAALLARERELPLLHLVDPPQELGAAIWNRLHEFRAAVPGDASMYAESVAERVPGHPGESAARRPSGRAGETAGERAGDTAEGMVERVSAAIADGTPRLLIIDGVDRAGAQGAEFLRLLVPRLSLGATALLATAAQPLGLPPEVRLGGLAEPELAELLPDLPAESVHAVWLATGGLPGPALTYAGELAGREAAGDALVHLALTVPSQAGFLDLDIGLIRLLVTVAEQADRRALPAAVRARVLARLARELLGDASAGARRRELIDEAVRLARDDGDPGTLAEVLDHRLHALWDPSAARDRLDTATEIVEQARRAGDAAVELRGLFWRFLALAELGELAAAEGALTAYARAAELRGDGAAAVLVAARQAMLETVRGRFDAARELIAEVAAAARFAGIADAERVVGTLNGEISALRGDFASLVEPWRELARRLPGHFFEATAARALAESGRIEEAVLELERLLPAVLAGAGPRWLGVAADLAIVAAYAGAPASARALYDALLPYRGRLVVWAGAVVITGPVDEYLGRLAIRLGLPDEAVAHLDAAAALAERVGALPWLARTLAARGHALAARGGDGDRERADDDLGRARSIAERMGLDGVLGALGPRADEWRLYEDGDGWLLEAGPERVRLPDGRGVRYLRTLLAAPGQEIAALDVVAGGAGLRAAEDEPVLDDAARAAYRRRIAELDERLDAADRAGDADRAATVQEERDAILAELRRATGLGGRPRAYGGEAERARVNATRALWATVRRVEAAAPRAGAHLRASLRTGRFLRYQPGPGGPARWSV